MTRNNSVDVLRFRLYGNFAHFNQPISNNFRNTYTIIPKTQLLGLIGSILGLSGYKNNRTEPEFYRELFDTLVYISPNLGSYPRFILNYNSLNSFLNNRKDFSGTNVIVKEQILVGPDYEIGIILHEKNELHERLVEMVRENRSIFPIYLGKNEFPASIDSLGVSPAKPNKDEEVIIRSIFPFEYLDKEKTRDGMRLEQLPIRFDERYKFIYKIMAIPNPQGSKVVVKEPNKFIDIDGIKYYVF